MSTHPIHLFSFKSKSCSVALGTMQPIFPGFPGKGSSLKDNNGEEFAGPQRATGFALLVVVSAVPWKMV